MCKVALWRTLEQKGSLRSYFIAEIPRHGVKIPRHAVKTPRHGVQTLIGKRMKGGKNGAIAHGGQDSVLTGGRNTNYHELTTNFHELFLSTKVLCILCILWENKKSRRERMGAIAHGGQDSVLTGGRNTNYHELTTKQRSAAEGKANFHELFLSTKVL